MLWNTVLKTIVNAPWNAKMDDACTLGYGKHEHELYANHYFLENLNGCIYYYVQLGLYHTSTVNWLVEKIVNLIKSVCHWSLNVMLPFFTLSLFLNEN